MTVNATMYVAAICVAAITVDADAMAAANDGRIVQITRDNIYNHNCI